MSSSTLLLYRGGTFKTRSARKFDKEVLRVGRWLHPVTSQEIIVSPMRLRMLERFTNDYMRANDGRIPFQDGHNFDAMKTLGWWTGFRIEGDGLIGTVEVTNGDAVRSIDAGSILGVSVRIDTNWSDQRGQHFPELITHVAATPVPVVDGLKDFVALSREGAALYRRENEDAELRAEAILRRTNPEPFQRMP